MGTLLHVFAHPTPEKSLTMRVAYAFVESYREAYPADSVVEVDLYREKMHHLTATHLEAMLTRGDVDKMTSEVRECWEELQCQVDRLLNADKLLVTAPMWNFGVPSIMKAYIDHVLMAGYTFRFTGPDSTVGMMSGRPLAIVSSRGGIYSVPPMSQYEMCVTYLRHAFEFLGYETLAELVAEGLSMVASHEREEQILAPLIARARQAAKTFDLGEAMKKAA